MKVKIDDFGGDCCQKGVYHVFLKRKSNGARDCIREFKIKWEAVLWGAVYKETVISGDLYISKCFDILGIEGK